jgi:hypothetical protein
MASKYFKNFPLVTYNSKLVRNIMLKSAFIDELNLGDTAFYTYEVKDGERPTTVAFNYYKSIDYVWLVFLSNQITDPYFEWPLSSQELDAHIIKKYGSLETSQQTIIEYKSDDYNITTLDTFNYYQQNGFPTENLTPVYAYDKEVQLNEQKRNIQLIPNIYSEQIAYQLEQSLG